jgi:hypothetical protein
MVVVREDEKDGMQTGARPSCSEVQHTVPGLIYTDVMTLMMSVM